MGGKHPVCGCAPLGGGRIVTTHFGPRPVKSYSQMDRGSVQRIDVSDGLESTLVMLSHKLHDVNVVRHYGVVPRIDAYASELNQVWTNLIDNAVDAMDGA